jgi:hypothetical protein
MREAPTTYVIVDMKGVVVPQEFSTVEEAERLLDSIGRGSDQPRGIFAREATEDDRRVIRAYEPH